MRSKTVLITGCAGFIGMHIADKLLKNKYTVCGIDNLNNYYDVKLKKNRISYLSKNKKFFFFKKDLRQKKVLEYIYKKKKFDRIIHLAAQAGVRYSLEKPKEYLENNIDVFLNILEFSKKFKINHLIYASSSSVYGNNKIYPFSEKHGVNHPISIYATTKKTNELMAHTYSKLFGLATTGIRFFTVYGPFGRPDMALFKFTKNIISGKKIEVYNNGNMHRDFTYIDDAVDALYKIFIKKPSIEKSFKPGQPLPNVSDCKFRIFNIGNNKSIKLNNFIKIIEKSLNQKAKIIYKPIQLGDVKSTVASNRVLKKWINQKRPTPHKIGVKNFINWYKNYFKI